jgi:hypothetical protein
MLMHGGGGRTRPRSAVTLGDPNIDITWSVASNQSRVLVIACKLSPYYFISSFRTIGATFVPKSSMERNAFSCGKLPILDCIIKR